MTHKQRIIQIHPDAPRKPAEGLACNGCGICCLAEPCPVGMLVSRRRRGACAALQWSQVQQRYLCGMLVAPLQTLGWQDGGRGRQAIARLMSRWASRLIAAGIGCDSSLEAERPDSETP